MDALMCDEGDVWDPKPEVIEVVKKEVDEITRYFDLFVQFHDYIDKLKFLSFI
jgi:hypothetical protein